MNGTDRAPEAAQHRPPEPLAVVGIGCRFPGGADDPESFWQLLASGVDAVSEIPPGRFNAAAFYDPDPARPGRMVSRWGGFVAQPIEDFDALFFGISPREAARLDPLQRWLLEVAWEALEDAGLVAERLAGSDAGVFVGVFAEDGKLQQLNEDNRELIDPYTGTGTAMTLAANRLSYVFDLHGPSIAVDTACSSSLVALHLACQSLWSGECRLALVGGANAIFRPEFTIAESKAGMLSPDGRCKAFDARANGYVRGEGAAIVVLKPLADALADGDPIRALICGTAVNQDGRTVGITVPSRRAQEALVREACRRAGIAPGDLHYVEAHGTGTPVGDPLELTALAAALADGRREGDACVIGSVKTNIGHLEAAAGVAGLIKAILCLERRAIPPHLHFREPHPDIPLADLCVRIPVAGEDWPATEGSRRAYAGVNSFGFGGTNAHAVLATAPLRPETATPARGAQAHLLPLSARSPEALRALAGRYRELLRGAGDQPCPPLADLCFTAGVRRSHHPHRLAVTGAATVEMAEQIDRFLAGEEHPGLAAGYTTPGHLAGTAFVYAGMGPQWWGMGRQLLAGEPELRAAVEECDKIFQPLAGWSLIAEMTAAEERSRMTETKVAQPAGFALQVGLTALWRSWGIVPDAVVGHSAGEIAALYVAGVLTLEDAVKVIFHRSRLQQRAAGQGGLLAVGAGEEEALRALEGFANRVSIAAINSHASVTLAGDLEALAAVARDFERRGVFCRTLRVEVPYHSHYLEPLREELLDSLREIAPRAPEIPVASTVTGRLLTLADLTEEHWWCNMRSPVRFAAATAVLAETGTEIFLEVGPHPVLAGAVTESCARAGRPARVLTSLRREQDELATLLAAAGALYAEGHGIAWEAVQGPGQHVGLPLYPWQRERYWEESAVSRRFRMEGPLSAARGAAAALAPDGAARHPLLGSRLAAGRPLWQSQLDVRNLPYLLDHRIQGALVCPGAALVEMALAAGRAWFGTGVTVGFADLEFQRALFLPEQGSATLQLALDPEAPGFEIWSAEGDDGRWVLHARGKLRQGKPASLLRPLDLAALRRRCGSEVAADDYYQRLLALGFGYGPTFRGIERLWLGAGEGLAHCRAHPDIAAQSALYHLHPALLDVSFQVLMATLVAASDGVAGTYMPVGAGRFCLFRSPGTRMWVHARVTARDAVSVHGDIRLLDEEGLLIAEVEGLHGVSLEERSFAAAEQLAELFYSLEWRRAERAEERPTPNAGGTWLVLADAGGIGRALADRLEAGGEDAVLVTPGDVYRFTAGARSGAVDPEVKSHWERLLADLAALGSPCSGVVHLWALDAPPATPELRSEELTAAQSTTCIAVLHLVQALAAARWRDTPRLWLVTRGAQAVGGGSPLLGLAQSPLWGLGRTLAYQEHPELWGALIDLDPGGDGDGDEVRRLYSEITRAGGETGGEQVALRRDGRYVPRLARRRELAEAALPLRLRADASYLVTGGLGGLGLAVAGWLAERGARRLILMGRTPLPQRASWDAAQEPAVAARIAAVRRLEAAGVSVHLAAVDAAAGDQLTDFLTGFRRDGWPPIAGVVHLAGVSLPKLVSQMDAAEFRSALRPKVAAAWQLTESLAGEPLDFFLLFSSLAAHGLSMGQGSYAAGNAFLDALAHELRRRGVPALAIGWGAWADIGMASLLDETRALTHRGFTPMPPRQALDGLDRLMGRDLAEVIVTAADWPQVAVNNFPLGTAPALLDELLAGTEPAAAAGPADQDDILTRLLLTEEAAERRALLQDHLHELAARVLRLGRSRLNPAAPLSELGLDSMMAVELRNRIDLSLGASPTVVELLQGASVASLAADLLETLPLDAAADAAMAEILEEIADIAAELGQRSGARHEERVG